MTEQQGFPINGNQPPLDMNGNLMRRSTWQKCDICNVPISSEKLMQIHQAGKRHTLLVKRANEKNVRKIFRCELCNIKANGEKQLQHHFASFKHKFRVEQVENALMLRNWFFYGTIIISIIFVSLTYSFYAFFVFF